MHTVLYISKLRHLLVNKFKGQTPMSPGKMFDAHRKVFSLEILMRNIKAQALTVQNFIRKVKVLDRMTELFCRQNNLHLIIYQNSPIFHFKINPVTKDCGELHYHIKLILIETTKNILYRERT